MKRREFIALLGATVTWPLAARAQQGEPVRRVGVLSTSSETDSEGHARIGALRQGLQELGWSEGRNLKIESGRLHTKLRARRQLADRGRRHR